MGREVPEPVKNAGISRDRVRRCIDDPAALHQVVGNLDKAVSAFPDIRVEGNDRGVHGGQDPAGAETEQFSRRFSMELMRTNGEP